MKRLLFIRKRVAIKNRNSGKIGSVFICRILLETKLSNRKITKKYGCHFKKIFADSIHNLNLFLKLYLSSTFFFLLKSTCVYISVVDIEECPINS